MSSTIHAGSATSIVHTDSLSLTVDSINEALFFERRIDRDERARAAHWIASRQGQPGAYAGMFAATETDFKGDLQLFTGEKITSKAGRLHILGQEALRALILLAAPDTEDAVVRASAEMNRRLLEGEQSKKATVGHYCCATCSCAMWRTLAVGGLDHSEERLLGGLKLLSQTRTDEGRWRGYPFFYTLLTLLEIPLLQAKSELRHAAQACQRIVERACSRDSGIYCDRRRAVVERALERC